MHQSVCAPFRRIEEAILSESSFRKHKPWITLGEIHDTIYEAVADMCSEHLKKKV